MRRYDAIYATCCTNIKQALQATDLATRTKPSSRTRITRPRLSWKENKRSYREACWYGPNPAAPMTHAFGSDAVPRASMVLRQAR